MSSRRISYANVTASIALFVALGGTGYAAIKLPAKSVGTLQLKSKAVTRAKIADSAVNGAKVKNGSLSGADIAGKVGAAFVADGLAQISRAVVPGTNDPAPAAPPGAFSVKAVTAGCPPGTYVVGGGANLADQGSQLVNDSYPSSATTWTANVANFGPAAVNFNVYAICVRAAVGG